MARTAKVEIGSSWKSKASGNVWAVIDRLPFGKLLMKMEGKERTAEVYQRDLLQSSEQVHQQAA